MLLMLALVACDKSAIYTDTAGLIGPTDDGGGTGGPGGPGGGGPGGGGPGGGTDGGGTDGGGTDGGGTDGGGPGGGTDGGGTDGGGAGGGDPVEGSIAGKTWSVDIADATYVEPPGLGSLVDLAGTTILLFHATSANETSFKMVVTVADDTGAQNPCERVVDLPTADFSDNPDFVIEGSELGLVVNDVSVSIADTLVSGTFEDGGDRWVDGVIRGTMDTREWQEALAADVSQDLCELVELMGSACGPCSDGANACFTLDLADVVGQPYVGSFDPDPRCE